MSIDAFSQAFGGTDWNQMTAAAQKKLAALPPAPPPAQLQTAAKDAKGDDDVLTFGDILDTINPLQHIPLVDVLYRHITGDTIRPQGKVLGGFLYGGLVGGAIATASALLNEATGVDAEETVYAALFGDSHPSQPETVASAGTTAAATATAAPTQGATAAVQTAEFPQLAATAPPTQLHPNHPTQPSTAAAAPQPPLPPAPPTHASAESRARQTIAAANTNALQQLALDLAGGGQVGADAGTTPDGSAPAAQPQSSPGNQRPPGRMPARGTTAPKNEMPTGYYDTKPRYGGYVRATAMVPSSAPLQTRPAPPAGPGTWKPLVMGGSADAQTLALTQAQAQAQAQTQTQPQAPIEAPPQLQPSNTGTQTAATVPPPEMISQLMMRNLDKYQAMSRNGGRGTNQSIYVN